MLTTGPTHAPPRRLILASQSPRRQELLQVLGWPFDVIPSSVDESAAPSLAPLALARWLAEQKAQEVAARHPGALVIGADTIVVIGDQVMGKPANAEDARRMLRTLSGATHRVITAIALRRAGPEPLALSEEVETEVTFRGLTDNEIEAYVRTGEPMDKAGAYAIQGYGALLVAGVRGDYPNIVGLPVARLAELLRSVGFRILGEPSEYGGIGSERATRIETRGIG
jgi:nucleoside triphosphate pyrophosphatase